MVDDEHYPLHVESEIAIFDWFRIKRLLTWREIFEIFVGNLIHEVCVVLFAHCQGDARKNSSVVVCLDFSRTLWMPIACDK